MTRLPQTLPHADASDWVPDDTTPVMFRPRLREAGLSDALFARVTVHLERPDIGVRPGRSKMLDATLVKAEFRPSRRHDGRDGGPSQDDAAAGG